MTVSGYSFLGIASFVDMLNTIELYVLDEFYGIEITA